MAVHKLWRLVILGGWSGCAVAFASEGSIVAGNGFRIDPQELESVIRTDLRRARVRGQDLQAVKHQGLNSLLEKKLLRREAERLGRMEAVQTKVASDVAAFNKRYATEQARKSFYVNSGVTEEILRERFEDVAVLRSIERSTGLKKPKFGGNTAASQPEILGKNDAAMVSEVIVLKGDASAQPSNETRSALAKQLAAKWSSEPEFVRHQMKNPGYKDILKVGVQTQTMLSRTGNPAEEDPKLKALGGGSTPPEVRLIAAKLKPGEVSEVIETDTGFYILRAGSPRVAKGFAKPKARTDQEKWDAYIEELKKRYEVKILANP